jgi:hypothetical protein|tara:strand:+ start:49 stop:801 length:753 start_codon:yes stop_codon:yes gene_type:complete
MASFQTQIMGLTDLSISSSGTNPTEAQLTQFLTDGAKEVINQLPGHLLPLCSSSQTFTSGSADTLTTGKILNVFRSDGDINQPCRKIPAKQKGRVSDPEEMSYATITDPVFFIDNNSLDVLPSGGSCSYSEVQYPAVAYSADAITTFPDEAEHLVVLYGAVKSLQNVLGSMNSSIVHSDQDGSYSASSSSSQGWEKVRDYIQSDEDVELSGASLSSLSSEMQQFIVEYQWYEKQQAKLQADYDKGIQALS